MSKNRSKKSLDKSKVTIKEEQPTIQAPSRSKPKDDQSKSKDEPTKEVSLNPSMVKNESRLTTKKETFGTDKDNVLEESGLLLAYQGFLKELCSNGLPTGNVYELAAQSILKYEKRFKQRQNKQYMSMRNNSRVKQGERSRSKAKE